ncbi:MAG: hypothetical protein AAF632_07650 [Bacteroidota bacterium]
MKNINYWFTITLCVVSTHLFAQDKQDEIIAIWDTGEAKIGVHQVGERYIGNPINPKGERDPAIEVLNLEYNQGKWVGKIYSKERDRLYDVECEVKDAVLLLEVDAGLLSRELEWPQVK